MSTAGLLIIGNEILSGKVRDENSPYLCQELRTLGVDVQRIHVIPDEVQTIAQHVCQMSAALDYVLTSGGVGPTHDDVTMEGISEGLSSPLVVNLELRQRLESFRGKDLDDEGLKMAKVPESSELLDSGDIWFPLVIVENVYVFPGIPKLLRSKFQKVRKRFKTDPFTLRRIHLNLFENDIARALDSVVHQFPKLSVGSYPRTDSFGRGVIVTVESKDPDMVEEGVSALKRLLPAEGIQQID